MPKRIWLIPALVVLVAMPATAEEMVIDYRDDAALETADPGHWRAIGEWLGGGVEVLGEVRGSFAAAGNDDVAYLISNSAPVASDPFPQLGQRLVVFEGADQIADQSLADTAAYSRPVAAVDVDGDGVSEIVLETSFYNMGTLAVGLDVMQLGETAEVIQSLPEVYVDRCEAGVGDRSISASAVTLVEGQLVANAETLACP